MTRRRIPPRKAFTHNPLRDLIPWFVIALLLALYTSALAAALTR